MARFLVAVAAFILAAVAAVSFRSQRDAYREDAIDAERTIDSACEQLAFEIDEVDQRLNDVEHPIGTDAGGPGFAQLRASLGLREDGTLESSRTYSWYREYLTCGANRDGSSKEMSDDAQAFRDQRTTAAFSARGPALSAALHDLSARVRAVKARPFHHATRTR